MARFLKSIKKAKGAAPGSLIFMGSQKMDNPKIRLFSYNEDLLVENEYETIDAAVEQINPQFINWLNIDGIHDTAIIQKIGKQFNISSLALENVLNTGQRSKFFEDSDSITLVTKSVYFDPEEQKISVEQISFILCANTLISFQEKVGDHFEPVRGRIRNKIGRIRKSSADYLLYTLVDSLVDNYLINIEQIGELVEHLEPRLSNPEKSVSAELFHHKTEITYFRKTIRPLKEVMTRILRSDSELFRNEFVVYYQELNDLVEHAYEAADTYYNMIGDYFNIYNTNVSNRANDVMKVLTIFASIFIPLTFIAGVYGTNFQYLPELSYRYSYYVMWAVMLVVAVGMLYFFKRNKWF